MAEPYLDRDRLIQFLGTHPPTPKGSIAAVLESSVKSEMRTDYYIVLEVPTPNETLLIGLGDPVYVADLFPQDARLFTMFEMADFADSGSLDEEYASRVQEQLKCMSWQLSWATDTHGSLDTGQVSNDEDLAQQLCYLRIKGSISSQASRVRNTLYSLQPYGSLSDDSFALSQFFSEGTLQEAWKESWRGGTRFREFT